MELLGGSREDVVRISAKTGVNVEHVLDAIVERIPAPEGDADAPARALVFDSSYDQYRGVIAFVRVVDGRLPTGVGLHAMAMGTDFDAEELGLHVAAARSRRGARGGRGRLRRDRPQGRLAPPGGRHADDAQGRGGEPAPGIQGRQADGLRRALPDRVRRLSGAPRRAREAQAQRRRPLLRARDVTGARVRVPLRLSRAPPHGDRPRAARARVRPRPARDGAERRVPGEGEERRLGRGAQPCRHAGRRRRGPGAVRPRPGDRPEGLRRAR